MEYKKKTPLGAAAARPLTSVTWAARALACSREAAALGRAAPVLGGGGLNPAGGTLLPTEAERRTSALGGSFPFLLRRGVVLTLVAREGALEA